MAPRAGQLLDLCKEALVAAGEAEVEIYAELRTRGVARFAESVLGQHMELVDPIAVVRVARGARVAEASTSRLDSGALIEAIRQAARLARVVPETDGFPGFTGEEPPGEAPPRLAPQTAACDAERRVDLLAGVFDRARAAELVAAGVLETAAIAAVCATTRGCERAHDATAASFEMWASAGANGARGYGGHAHRDVDALRIHEETERAIRIASMSRDPVALDPGAYDVVFEPPAVAEIVERFGAIAFPASAIADGTSPLAGRIGESVTRESITIADDPLDPSELGFGAPFDREGTWRRRVPLIERGIARGALYDRAHAARAGTRSTGSAAPLPRAGAIAPASLAMDGGDAAGVEELIAGVERGLYVCRMHHVDGLLDPRRAVVSGQTRDGLFLVENGRIARAAVPMRFECRVLDALARCDGMTRARAAIPVRRGRGATIVPAIRVRALRFDGLGRAALGEEAVR